MLDLILPTEEKPDKHNDSEKSKKETL